MHIVVVAVDLNHVLHVSSPHDVLLLASSSRCLDDLHLLLLLDDIVVDETTFFLLVTIRYCTSNIRDCSRSVLAPPARTWSESLSTEDVPTLGARRTLMKNIGPTPDIRGVTTL